MYGSQSVFHQDGMSTYVQSWYRQWQEMGPYGRIMNTDTPEKVTKIFTYMSNKWIIFIQEAETISFSDTNINFNTMDVHPTLMDPP